MPAEPRYPKRRTVVAAALAIMAACACGGAREAAVALAVTPAAVTVQTVYENTPVSVNMSDAVGYEFTNTTGVAETVSLTDALPQGVVVDNPAALTNTAAGGTCVVESYVANPGAGSVALTVQVPSSTAAAIVCTVSVGIVPGAPSQADAPLTDAYGGLSAVPHASSLTAKPGGLIVLSDPVLTVTAPSSGQFFALAQLSDASFACATSDPLDSVDNFFGTDDRGNQIASGEPIDTVDPGTHTLAIECYSAAGGGYVAQTVSYTVGSYALTKVRLSKSAQVSFRTVLPAGKLVTKLLVGKTTIATNTAVVSAPEALSTKVRPTRAGLRALRSASAGIARLELVTSFTPSAIGTGDAEITPTSAIVLTRFLRLPASVIRNAGR